MPSGAPHTPHPFIGDKENAMPSADFGHTLQIAGRRQNCAKGCSADRFKDKSSHFALGGFDRLLQFPGIFLSAIAAAIAAVKGTTVAIWKWDMGEFPHHRKIDVTPPLVSRNLQRAQGGPMIAFPTADHLMPLGLSDLHLVLSR